MYSEGTGVPQNDVEAVKWYRNAAEQGSDQAQLALRLMYEAGRGVPEDNANLDTSDILLPAREPL